MAIFNFLNKDKPDQPKEGRLLVDESKTDQQSEEANKPAYLPAEPDGKEKEIKEKINQIIMKLSSFLERIELLERKMDRIENKLGMKNEAQ